MALLDIEFWIFLWLPLAYLIVDLLFRRQAARFGGRKIQSYQLLNSQSLLLQLNIVPKWLCPMQDGVLWRQPPSELYKDCHDDIHCHVSPLGALMTVANAEVAKEMCNNKVDFTKPIEIYGVLDLFGPNIVTTLGDVWKKHRRVLGPSFGETNNRLVHEQTLKLTRQMMDGMSRDILKTGDKSAIVDLGPAMVKMTLLVISSAGFGVNVNWDETDVVPDGHKLSYHQAIDIVDMNTLLRIMTPKWAYRLLPSKKLQEVDLGFKEFEQYMREMIAESRKSLLQSADSPSHMSETADILNAIVQAGSTLDENGRPLLSDDEILGDCFIVLFAGHETTAHTLMFVFALLATHPDIQQKLLQSFESILENGRLSNYDDFGQLEYASALILETLRLYPVVVNIPKVTATDVDIAGCVTKKGMMIALHTVGLHRNPKYWKDPLQFRPERFMPENRDSIVAGSFIPFSDGSRSCIGRRFAMVESVCVLATLVPKYHITLADPANRDTILDLKNIVTLSPANPVKLKFTPRVSL
eukprot:Partr_v1_DN28228_c2_g1_i1_m75687 putative cytochrome P450